MYIKLPPRKCNNCGYQASGGAFKKTFGRFWYGKERCPKCKSTDIVDKPKEIIDNLKPLRRDETIHLQWIYDRLVNKYGEIKDQDYMIKLANIIDRK